MRRFSWDLVPLVEGAAPRKDAPGAPAARTMTILFRGTRGERIPLAGKNISYDLSALAGDRFQRLTRVRGAPAPAVIELPETGMYKLALSSYTRAPLLAHRPAVFLVAAGQLWLTGTTPPLFFYVPHGTRSVAVRCSAQGGRTSRVKVKRPDGSVTLEASLRPGQEAVVRVPDGAAVAAWSVEARGIGIRPSLLGVPPFVATSPDRLLVPRETLRH